MMIDVTDAIYLKMTQLINFIGDKK